MRLSRGIRSSGLIIEFNSYLILKNRVQTVAKTLMNVQMNLAGIMPCVKISAAATHVSVRVGITD